MKTLYATISTPFGDISARYEPADNRIFACIGDYCHAEWHPQSGEAQYVNQAKEGYGPDHVHCTLDSKWWDEQESRILSELFTAWRKV